MGDTGSQLLGFSAIVFAIKITQGETAFSPVVPLIILGFPVLDTLMVMSQRISEGMSPFKPDKNHFHHRLMRLGLSRGGGFCHLRDPGCIDRVGNVFQVLC